MTTDNPLDFAFRTIESIAFSLHSILGLTEPFTGCLRGAFRDNGAMPSWFWPVAGAILLLIAIGNFSGNNAIVLACQAYIAAFHIGAIMYHIRLGHNPLVGLAPGVFVVFAFIVASIRTSILVALVGTTASAIIAFVLCNILVKPVNSQGHHQLLDGYEHIDDQASEERTTL